MWVDEKNWKLKWFVKATHPSMRGVCFKRDSACCILWERSASGSTRRANGMATPTLPRATRDKTATRAPQMMASFETSAMNGKQLLLKSTLHLINNYASYEKYCILLTIMHLIKILHLINNTASNQKYCILLTILHLINNYASYQNTASY